MTAITQQIWTQRGRDVRKAIEAIDLAEHPFRADSLAGDCVRHLFWGGLRIGTIDAELGGERSLAYILRMGWTESRLRRLIWRAAYIRDHTDDYGADPDVIGSDADDIIRFAFRRHGPQV